MLSPPQARPVRRPDLVVPETTVDVMHGTADEMVAIRIQLLNGANYNDPARFAFPAYNRMMVSGWAPH
ncbi:MAG: hypothetical protein QOJ57_1831 [Thermoleophilaceae bacterium]|jgi:cyanobactin biosynthesis protein (PatB/AcyB/McaB family)|nr:hypothetical protein [Thermoleophilaceae bacterium]